VVSELLENNFSVLLYQSDNESAYGGWVDVDNRQLAATVGGWNGLDIQVLIHEYSHFLQWKTKRIYYLNKVKHCGTYFNWLEGEDHKDSVIDKSLKKVIELEWDCECNVIKLIKKYKLDIDITNYIKCANSSLLFYHISREKRKWCEYSPSNSDVIKNMPEDLKTLDFYLDKSNIDEQQRKKYLEIVAK
jgi:hypothetical protein